MKKEENFIKEINTIGLEEKILMSKMPYQGHIEQRDEFLKKNGIYDAWRKIYSNYVKLTKKGSREALKRALFFAWYQLAEPFWLSGIGQLQDNETIIVVKTLELLLEQGIKDKELEYMLPYYMRVCDYYLERFYPLPNIEKASMKNIDNQKNPFETSHWHFRGKMGEYWGNK